MPPNTPKGKARSRMNAFKHGLRATDELFLVHLKPREREVFQSLRASLVQEYKPKSTQEELLVDRLAIEHFRLYRLYQIEYRVKDAALLPNLDRFSRYDGRIERHLRALHNRLCSLKIRSGDTTFNSFTAKE